jgi:hypothetical protein
VLAPDEPRPQTVEISRLSETLILTVNAPVNANGGFEFPQLPPGNYALRANAPGALRVNIVLKDDDITGVELKVDAALARMTQTAATAVSNVMIFLFLATGLSLYCMPIIVAVLRRHHRQNAIGLLNLLLGWSGVGWIGAMIWAAIDLEQADTLGQPVGFRKWLRLGLWLLAPIVGFYLAGAAFNNRFPGEL